MSGAGVASRLLAAAAQRCGAGVDRLSPEVVLCRRDGRAVLFHGLTGARSGKAAHVLCGEPAWLRDLLTRAGVPARDGVPARGVPAPGGAGPDGAVVQVAVVAGDVIAVSPAGEAPESVRALAVAAVAALPSAGYAAVRVVCLPDGPVVDDVDPELGMVADLPSGDAHRVAAAIVAAELG